MGKAQGLIGGRWFPWLLVMHLISLVPVCCVGPLVVVVWSVTNGSLNASCPSTPSNTQLNPTLRFSGSAQLGNNGYLFGGEDCKGHYSNGVIQVDLSAQTAVAIQQYLLVADDAGSSGSVGVYDATYRPPACQAPCLWASGDSLFAYGGFTSAQIFSDLWSFNITSRSWANLSSGSTSSPSYPPQMGLMGSFNPGPRFSCGSAQNGSHLFLMGGQSLSADIWAYAMAVQEWTWIGGSSTSTGTCGSNTGLPLGAVYACYASSTQGEIWRFGGDSGTGFSNELWYWNPAASSLSYLGGSCYGSNSSSTPPTDLPIPRSLCALTLYHGFLVLFGGANKDTTLLNDLWVYYPEVGSWVSLSRDNSSVVTWMNDSNALGPNYAGSMFASTNSLLLVAGSSLGNALVRIQSDCLGSGLFVDPTTWSCTFCGVGRQVVHGICVDCPAGKSSVGNGSVCYDCSLGSYSSGGDSCIGCPSGATTFSVRSTSVSQCFCPSDTYGYAYVDKSCTSCVGEVGITCPPNSSIPSILPGYARDPASPNSWLACVPSTACSSTGYNLSTTCALGYIGSNCGSCSSGYFREGLYCKACPSPFLGVLLGGAIVVAIFALISVVVYKNKSCGVNPLLRVTLTSLQFIGTFPLITASWPSALQSFLNIVSLSNLNIDLVSPECTFGSVSIYAKLAFKLSLPIIAWLLLSVLIAFSVSCRSRDLSFRNELSGRVGPVGLAISLSFYTLAVQATLQPFQCLQQPNGRYTLYSDPATYCYEGTWMQYLPMFIMGLLLYLVAMPVFLALLFKRVASSKALQSKYEFSLQDYRIGYAWWELINMLRRACLVAVVSLILGQAKYFVAMLALLSFIIVETMVAPYKDPRLGQYSMTWGFVCLLTLIAVGAVFQSTEVSDFQKGALGIFIIVLIGVTAVFSLSMRIIRCCCPQRRVALFADGSMVHGISANGLSVSVAVPPILMTSSINTVSMVVEFGTPRAAVDPTAVEVYQASSAGQGSVAV